MLVGCFEWYFKLTELSKSEHKLEKNMLHYFLYMNKHSIEQKHKHCVTSSVRIPSLFDSVFLFQFQFIHTIHSSYYNEIQNEIKFQEKNAPTNYNLYYFHEFLV